MIFQRLLDGMHEPFQREPGAVLTTLLKAFTRGLESIHLGAAQQALYLDSARGRWLSEWADLYAYERGSLNDADLLAEMQSQTVLERRQTTLSGLKQQILRATGFEAVIELTGDKTLRFDHFGADWSGLDYGAIQDGVAVLDDTPQWHRGSLQRLPLGPQAGPSGVIIQMPTHWTAALEDKVMEVVRHSLKAGSAFELGWTMNLSNDLSDELLIEDNTYYPASGWGIDGWGSSTWG